jgi:hypothetical protein
MATAATAAAGNTSFAGTTISASAFSRFVFWFTAFVFCVCHVICLTVPAHNLCQNYR